ncbi:MAG: hypothetical protein D6811_12160 [Alphaproteobacteria bacterium]|nr:MAG: hypothetical protein D6811_12160 [Alphaproteobacteria bacterium]
MEALRGELAAIEGREAEVTAELRRALQQGNLSAEALARFYELRQEAEIARSQYAALLARQRQLEAQAPIQLADARIVSEALAPGTPSFPNRRMILGVGALLALGLGFAFALAREIHFDGITSPERLETVLGLPVAATLPRHPAGRRDAAGCDGAPADAVARAPLSAYAEAVRALRAALDRQLPPTAEAARVVMICSAQAGEGKSTTALALARAHAQLGQRVILVDADLRRPSLHALIGACPLYGLADYLADPHTEPEGDGFLVQDPLSAATLVVGRPWSESATDRLLLSPAFMALMAHLRSIAELVVIDTPPLLGMVDGEILAGGADAAVLVSRFGRSSQAALRAARARLDAALPSGAPVLAVLNGAEAWSAAAGSAPLYYHA